MSQIYLVRHGESVANTQGVYQGITYDTPLSDLGKKQALSLAERFGEMSLHKVIASPLKRTWQTAAVVASYKQLNVEMENDIIETNHGLWEGKHKDDIAKNWPEVYRKWQKFPSSVKFPQGEHFLDTQNRVIKWWDKITNSNTPDTLVVTHDNIIRIIIARVLNMKLNRIWKFHLQPTAITKIKLDTNTAQLIDLNNTSHLGDLQTNLAIHAL